jgi:ketosteroid isomerase-like protein
VRGLAEVLSESEPGAEPARPASAQSDEALRLAALERDLVAAIGRKDLAAYDRIVADDYTVQDIAGKTLTKPEIMASYRSGARGYRDLEIEDVVARIYGDTAVVTARTRGFRIENGQETPNRVRYMRVYARRGGMWKAVAQMSAPEQSAEPKSK